MPVMFLHRTDVPELLDVMDTNKLPTLGAALILSDWTTMPPCALSRHLNTFKSMFEALPDLWEEVQGALMAKAICKRTSGSNRHGHCAANPFPGPALRSCVVATQTGPLAKAVYLLMPRNAWSLSVGRVCLCLCAAAAAPSECCACSLCRFLSQIVSISSAGALRSSIEFSSLANAPRLGKREAFWEVQGVVLWKCFNSFLAKKRRFPPPSVTLQPPSVTLLRPLVALQPPLVAIQEPPNCVPEE